MYLLYPLMYAIARKHRNVLKIEKRTFIGAYSVDENRDYESGIRNLKYLNIPNHINFNLNDGDYKDKPAYIANERIIHMKKFIDDYNEKITKDNRIDANFVCSSGVLRILMQTPYNKSESWLIHAVKLNGTIYLCSIETEESINEQNSRTDEMKKWLAELQRYGFKYESYVVSDHPQQILNGSSKTVVEAEEFCVVQSINIDRFKIMFTAEIDGVDCNNLISTADEIANVPLIEVKTYSGLGSDIVGVRHEYLPISRFSNLSLVDCKSSNKERREKFCKDKALNWWCQSFIAGIDLIYVGLRNYSGIVTDVKEVNIHKLAEFAGRNDYWQPDACLEFLKDFLDLVDEKMSSACDSQVFCYSWKPKYNNTIIIEEKEGGNEFFKKTYLK